MLSYRNHQAVASRDASVAEKQRVVEAKEHENKTHGEMLHRANQVLFLALKHAVLTYA